MEWTITSTLVLAAGMVAAYLLGSINFAIIVTRLFKKGDIRDYGSGNAGMTNVLRTVGKTAALLTLLGDFSKGILSVLFVRLLVLLFHVPGDIVIFDYLVAFAALLGHLFPVFYGFKGGKGILVSAGAMLILSPWALLCCFVAFMLFAATTRYISLGSIVAGVMYPVANLFLTWMQYGSVHWTEVILSALIGALAIFMHRANIKRLLSGTESKVSFKKKSAEKTEK